MGLDIFFYAEKRTEVGYFRKINFFLTYFGVDENGNLSDIEISKEDLSRFVEDLRAELRQHNLPFDEDEILGTKINEEPNNPLLRCKRVPFGGSTEYNQEYWCDVVRVYRWANGLLESFDFQNNKLVLNAWW